MAAVSGICMAFANIINLYLSGVMDAVIFFPVVNGANIVLTTPAGIVLFKESLTKKQWVGLLLGAISLLFIVS